MIEIIYHHLCVVTQRALQACGFVAQAASLARPLRRLGPRARASACRFGAVYRPPCFG